MIETISPLPTSTLMARIRALGRVLPLWPHEIADPTLAGQERICRMLSSALRRERQRGVAGHWTYDIGRHAALARALRPELRRLALMRRVAQTSMPAGGAGMGAISS